MPKKNCGQGEPVRNRSFEHPRREVGLSLLLQQIAYLRQQLLLGRRLGSGCRSGRRRLGLGTFAAERVDELDEHEDAECDDRKVDARLNLSLIHI